VVGLDDEPRYGRSGDTSKKTQRDFCKNIRIAALAGEINLAFGAEVSEPSS
jgi:hypothetical protein